MGCFDKKAFTEALTFVAQPDIDRDKAERAIRGVYASWVHDLRCGIPKAEIEFSKYYPSNVFVTQPIDLIEAITLLEVVARYFNIRALIRLRELARTKAEHDVGTALKNPVKGCSHQHVVIQVTDEIELTINARCPDGELRTKRDLYDPTKSVRSGDGYVPSPQYGRAIARAIRIMNEKRGFA